MPGKAAKVQLSKQQRIVLTEFSKSRSLRQFLSQSALILCLAQDGPSNQGPSVRRSD